MMMGVGLLFMLLIGVVVIGIPALLIALVARGDLAKLFKPQTGQAQSDQSSSPHMTTVDRKCPTCGRAVRPDWNICPSCGATLT
jgi:predicted RNA-binding Zn-ribbon protein involved in translation (DUF1610 family)